MYMHFHKDEKTTTAKNIKEINLLFLSSSKIIGKNHHLFGMFAYNTRMFRKKLRTHTP